MSTIDDYKRILAQGYLPITLEELDEIIWKHLQGRPAPKPGESLAPYACCCVGARPMVEGIKRDIRALIASRAAPGAS